MSKDDPKDTRHVCDPAIEDVQTWDDQGSADQRWRRPQSRAITGASKHTTGWNLTPPVGSMLPRTVSGMGEGMPVSRSVMSNDANRSLPPIKARICSGYFTSRHCLSLTFSLYPPIQQWSTLWNLSSVGGDWWWRRRLWGRAAAKCIWPGGPANVKTCQGRASTRLPPWISTHNYPKPVSTMP